MTENEMRLHRCGFTGHRPQKLKRPEYEIKVDLEDAIKLTIADGYTTFITGMAYGVDIWTGQIVIRLRKRFPELRLIAAVPFRGFENRWSADWKAEYYELLGQADLVRYICQKYNAGAYQRRNEWVVDHTSRMIAVFNGEPSGTKNTIDYSRKNNVRLVQIKA